MKQFIPWAKPAFHGREKEYLIDAFESNWVSGGPYVDKFEQKFIRLNRAKYGTSCSNGTAALHLALLALGIGPGDEVIVPGFAFAAAANMVLLCGGKPIYADIDPKTWCISPGSIQNCLSSKTRAIVAVHTYGNLCNMDSIIKIAQKYNIPIIEDAAEAAFSKYGHTYAGNIGDIGCFSFQATKTISTGEGGFIITNNPDLHKKILLLKNHGMKRPKYYWHEIVAHNFRLTNLQAAIGLGQLENIEQILYARKKLYENYNKYLSKERSISMQRIEAKTEAVIWAIAVKIETMKFKGNRDFIIKSLLNSGIETRPGFYPFSAMKTYNAPELENSIEVSKTLISLPSFTELSENDIAYICKNLLELKI